jgi:hypothetical protein
MATLTDLQRAYNALSAKATPYQTLWAYYDGDQPLRYANPNLKTKFRKLVEHFTANWCAVVVDSLTDRLDLSGLSHEDEGVAKRLASAWDVAGMDVEAEEVHKAVGVTGEGFIVADIDDDGTTAMFSNPPEICHVFYESSNPKRKRFAAKWWVDEYDERRYLSLYYPERIENYVSKRKANNVQSANAFELTEEGEVANPFNPVIPVFHFRRDRRSGKGELQNVIDLQDAFNKLFADMMMASEFGAFKQRYVISNADTAKLKNAPNEIWEIPAGEQGEQPTTVGQFDATELANFTTAMDFVANKVAVVTRTPKHYLLATGGDPSGEALLVAESGLVKKTTSYQRRLDPAWTEVAAFLLSRAGITTDRASLKVTWNDARTVQPLAEGQARQLAIAAGIPLDFWLEHREGWTPDEIVDMNNAAAEAQAKQSLSMGEAMVRAMRDFNGGDNGATPEANVAAPAVPTGG